MDTGEKQIALKRLDLGIGAYMLSVLVFKRIDKAIVNEGDLNAVCILVQHYVVEFQVIVGPSCLVQDLQSLHEFDGNLKDLFGRHLGHIVDVGVEGLVALSHDVVAD